MFNITNFEDFGFRLWVIFIDFFFLRKLNIVYTIVKCVIMKSSKK